MESPAVEIVFQDETKIPHLAIYKKEEECDSDSSWSGSESGSESEDSTEEEEEEVSDNEDANKRRPAKKRKLIAESQLQEILTNCPLEEEKVYQSLKDRLTQCEDTEGLSMLQKCQKDKTIQPLISTMSSAIKKKCLEICRKKEIKKADKKAALKVSWNAYLNDFKPGLQTRERKLVVQLDLKAFSANDVHRFITHLHSVVYTIFHGDAYTYEKNKSNTLEDQEYTNNKESKESKEKIYCFAGASLCRMINTRKKALKGCGREISMKKRGVVVEELKLIDSMTDKHKSKSKSESVFLKELDLSESDSGGLFFPCPTLYNFLCCLDSKTREQINSRTLKKYGSGMLKVAESCILHDIELSNLFKKSLSVVEIKENISQEVVTSIFKELTKKYLHAREGEFKSAKEEIELAESGQVVNTTQNLRDKLKTYTISQKRVKDR